MIYGISFRVGHCKLHFRKMFLKHTEMKKRILLCDVPPAKFIFAELFLVG